MRKLIACIALLSLSILTATAEIKVKKENKILLIEFYYPKDSVSDLFNENDLGMDYIVKDLREALITADREKCNTAILYDREGGMFKIIKGKEKFHDVEATIESLVGDIEGMSYTEFKEGKIIGERKVRDAGAKYRQDTYLNGKLQSTYEADWSQGWFAPTTSTYKSGADTYETRTYYLPPSTKTVYDREPGTNVTVPGSMVFTKKMYRAN